MTIAIAARPWLRLLDSKRVHHALFGVHYEEDIFELVDRHLPRLMPVFKPRLPAAMRAREVIFVHVPRAAGTSICKVLYGGCGTRHHSIRYYRAIDPEFFAAFPSFAVLRDPVARFLSGYRFVRAGGTATCHLSAVFRAATGHIGSIDDYLDFLEGRAVMALDFVMRPQSWFVCDLQTGAPLVKNLFLLGEARLSAFLEELGVTWLPHLNASEPVALHLSAAQKRRIERLYAQDFALVEQVRRQCRPHSDAGTFSIAAE